MRLVIIIWLSIFFAAGCTNSTGNGNDFSISKRDTTISPQNAFNDLFLDSMTVSNFVKNETDSVKRYILSFYNSRNYQFAWFDEDGLNLAAEGFWNRHDSYLRQLADSSFFDQQLHATMDTLLYADSTLKIERATIVQTELLLTKHFFNYIQTAYGPKADPEELQWHIPKRKLNVTAMLDSLLAGGSRDWQPLNPRFHQLQNAVIKYRQIEHDGGWGLLDIPKRSLKKGNENEMIRSVKKRLAIEGHYDSSDTTAVFNDSLFSAIKKVQNLYGQKPTGIIDKPFLNELNVSSTERIRQMLVNLERMKWMPVRPDNFIFINIPEYRFRLIRDGRKELEMDIVVGKAANRTVIFSDELKYIVFSPYWNIPRSIVRNEIVPAMERDKNYLRKNNMEITGHSGGLPIIRQKPGRNNALGRVKFLFPNSYNIYFHDTPAKSLFKRERRAFSHGCIRLEDPFSLTRLLLNNEGSWTDAEIQEQMNRDTEKWITLKNTWPVFVTYFTSWVDDEGHVNFREDIYGHDKKLKERLFS